MNRILILVSLIAIIVWGCKKPDDGSKPYYDPNNADLEYSLSGLHDTFVEQSGKVTMPLFINRLIGKPEDVSFNAYNLPPGIQVYLSPSVGTPSFNTILNIETDRAAKGTYPITITGVSTTSGLKNFNMTLRVIGYSNPSLALEGTFKETRTCSQSGPGNNDVTVETVQNQTNKIRLTGIWVGGSAYSVIVDVNPLNKSMTMAPQVQNSLTFSGSGSYTDENSFTITYLVSGNLVNDNCTSSFNRL